MCTLQNWNHPPCHFILDKNQSSGHKVKVHRTVAKTSNNLNPRLTTIIIHRPSNVQLIKDHFVEGYICLMANVSTILRGRYIGGWSKSRFARYNKSVSPHTWITCRDLQMFYFSNIYTWLINRNLLPDGFYHLFCQIAPIKSGHLWTKNCDCSIWSKMGLNIFLNWDLIHLSRVFICW